MSSGGGGRVGELGTLTKDPRQGGLPGVEDETGWKLVSYILMMLGWRARETPRWSPEMRSEVRLEMWIWGLYARRR